MRTQTPLVLVADDEPSMLELVARHLRTMDQPKLDVIQASDGEEAWRLARQHLPDLVVLDVMMPGMSGWEVCRKIREDVALAHTGVVMLTGIGENLNEMTSPLYGADAFIDKPFEFEEFDDKVRDTLKSRERQREGVVRAPVNGTVGGARPALPQDDAPRGKKAKAVAKKGKAAAAKPAAKQPAAKAPAKKAAVAAKAVKKPAAKKPVAKAPAKKPVAKAPAKKPVAKKPVAKKPVAKKPVAKAPAKKPVAKKAAAKAPAKKPVAKKAAKKKR
jgi:DNA-binding response OmpR family regulator